MSKKTYAQMMARLSPEERQAYLAKARDRQRRLRESGAVAEWRSRPEVRERIKNLKASYRRNAGVPSREEMAAATAAKQAAREKQRELRKEFEETFCGPPKPHAAMTDSDYYRWKTRNSPEFYARELDRAQRYKAKTRPGYKDSVVKWADMPAAVQQAKHAVYLIARELEGIDHENHQ